MTQHHRQVAYDAAIAPFRHDLPLGMSRTEVKQYLDSKGIDYISAGYGPDAETYTIEIGEEPGSLVCESWKVYIALEFQPSDKTTDSRDRREACEADKLTDIHIRKIGTCL